MLRPVLDLGLQPAADHFPPADSVVSEQERSHPLRMDMCTACGLAQLADDDTIADEPRGIEPLALQQQAADAVRRVGAAGWLRGATAREFGSPHGGTWIPLLTSRGYRPAESADVVLDSFGIMHDADQRAAFRRRRAATNRDGVLLLHFHSLLTIVRAEQWNALRHGHFAYYSLTALRRLLADVGMSVATSWEFDLYGGTVLVAAVHGSAEPDSATAAILAREADTGVTDPAVVSGLSRAAQSQAAGLHEWLTAARAAGRTVYAYGASSRAVALLCLAGADRQLLAGVADAAPAKQGRRMPGTDIPIVDPETMVAAAPDDVLLTVPDLLPEVAQRFPRLEGRWRTDWSKAPTGVGVPIV